MDYRISIYSISGYGQRTDQNGLPLQEDCIYPPAGRESDDDRLFIVCDGMGGYNAGYVAAKTVCDAISRYFINRDEGQPFNIDDIRQAIGNAYIALDQIDNTGREKMGTTMAMLKLYEDGYYISHIGDSRVYHIRPGRNAEDTTILFCTRDHTLVNYLVSKGEMTPEEALASPKRHIITRAMQPHMAHRSSSDVHSSDHIRPGDYFLLCTDGMLENLTDDNIRSIFSYEGDNERNKMGILAKVANNSVDNYSAIIVHINDVIVKMPKDQTSKRKFIPKTDDMQPVSQTKASVASKTRDFVRKRKEKGDAGALFIKFLIAVMLLLSIIMVIYYLFIHTDETLQTAGTAIDSPIEINSEGGYDSETYGYEITEQDKMNAQESTSVEPEEAIDEEMTEEGEMQEDQATEDGQAEQPAATAPANNEPILQE